MNTRQKMYRTNADIKKYLKEKGFYDLYLVPHLRHSKDYFVGGIGFDALGCKKGEKRLFLLQFKTNKKAPKDVLKKFKKINKKHSVKCLWITKFDGGRIEVYE